jgi:hypothetical protein
MSISHVGAHGEGMSVIEQFEHPAEMAVGVGQVSNCLSTCGRRRGRLRSMVGVTVRVRDEQMDDLGVATVPGPVEPGD